MVSRASPLDALQRPTAGGTALLWRQELSTNGQTPDVHHRYTGRCFGSVCIVSFYGPQTADMALVRDALHCAEEDLQDRAAIIIGDWNWKPCYDQLQMHGWQWADPRPTTLGSQAAPTRCVVRHAAARQVEAFTLLGVPHHYAVVYEVQCKTQVEPQRQSRLRRTSIYHWVADPTLAEEERLRRVYAGAKTMRPVQLDERFAWWHRTAEAVCREAATMGLVHVRGRTERPKGKAEAERDTAHPPAGRMP